MKTKTRRSDTAGELDWKTERWAAGLTLGLAIAERADEIEAADAIQILDADGNVVFTAKIGSVR